MRQQCHRQGERIPASTRFGPARRNQQPCQPRASFRETVVQHVVGTVPRRVALLVGILASISQDALAEQVAVGKVTVRPELTPDQSKYDPADPQLRAAAQLLQDALNAPTVEQEEALWTKIIKEYGAVEAPWGPDIVGRAWGNRGNARSRQGKLQEALQDYNTAIDLCPWSVDPLLNRGAVLEQLGRFKEAEDDYLSILDVSPDDPAAWNNLGNTNLGMGNYDAAARYFGRAASMAPTFSFASANRCVALFAAGRTNESMREMRAVLRRYPDFPDTRAALTAALWSIGKEAEAESNWQRVDDPRYRDKQWLREDRRWPPELVKALSAFLEIRTVA
eukprot:jgi/Ulvmu1/8804/UM048_0059.1